MERVDCVVAAPDEGEPEGKRRRLLCEDFASVARCDAGVAQCYLAENDWEMEVRLAASASAPRLALPRRPRCSLCLCLSESAELLLRAAGGGERRGGPPRGGVAARGLVSGRPGAGVPSYVPIYLFIYLFFLVLGIERGGTRPLSHVPALCRILPRGRVSPRC